MIKGVIFDLGRTLIYKGERSKVVDQKATDAMLAFFNRKNISINHDFISRFRESREQGWRIAEKTQLEQPLKIALRKAFQATNGSKLGLEKCLCQAVETYYEVCEQYWLAYSDTIDVLAEIRALGLRLGAISNFENDSMIRKALNRLEIAPYLSPIITSAEVKWRKPNPKIFQLVSRKWKLHPHEIVVIGNSIPDDIVGAHAAGMHSILVCNNQTNDRTSLYSHMFDQKSVKPDISLSSLAGVPEVIAQMNWL